jgi:carboxymethylenebutenolidase
MHDMQRYLVEEFAEDYLEGTMPRRDLLRRVLLMTGSVAVTAGALAKLGVPAKRAEAATVRHATPREEPVQRAVRADDDPSTDPPPMQTTDNVVDPSDPAISAGMVTFPGPAGTLYGYLAQPATGGPYPGLIVIHENRGLIEPNMDICRRYAKLGYVAMAVDLASRAGGTDALSAQDPMQVTGFLGSASPDDLTADLVAGLASLALVDAVDANRLGATGFCYGGGMTWRLAAASNALKAAVPFYGPNPPLDQAANITAACLGIYGALDTRITGASTDLDAVLDQAGVTHSKIVEPNANHAFFNNTGAAYNPDAALDAWRNALAWFGKYLMGA